MFTKLWFQKNQKLLIWFANTFLGRLVLGFYLNKTNPKRIVKITPNSVHWIEGKKIKAEFLTDSQYAQRLQKILYPLWALFHLWDMFWYPNYNLGFDTLTSNPDAHTETTSVDGRVFEDGQDLTWANIHDAATGSGFQDDVTATQHVFLRCSGTTNQWAGIYRSIYLFNTSALTSSAIISAGVFSLYVTAVDADWAGSEFDLVTSSPASNTALADVDYDQVGTTKQATSIAFSSLSTSAYNDFTLNATGLTNVSKTGITKLGGRISFDTSNTEQTWSNAKDGSVTANYADVGSNKPKLVITYTLPSSAFFALL